MEGFTICKVDDNFIYYKCLNLKSKNCKCIIKENKLTFEFIGTAHNDRCKLATKRKASKFGLSMDNITPEIFKKMGKNDKICNSFEEIHNSISKDDKSELSSIYRNTLDVEASFEDKSFMDEFGSSNFKIFNNVSKTTYESGNSVLGST
jgi:hypothetical protein